MRRIILGFTVLALALASVGGGATVTSMTLRPTTGGVLVVGRLTTTKPDQLVALWSTVGRARLLRCIPTCRVVTALPVSGSLSLGPNTAYRVVIGGKANPGQRVTLVLRLKGGQVLDTVATVVR